MFDPPPSKNKGSWNFVFCPPFDVVVNIGCVTRTEMSSCVHFPPFLLLLRCSRWGSRWPIMNTIAGFFLFSFGCNGEGATFARLFYGCSNGFHLSGDNSRDRCIKGS